MFRRILIYSHDSYGLGHFRRNLTIAGHLLSRNQDLSILAVTGSPRAHSFRLPHRLDYVKLPAATKDRDGAYVARELPMELERLVELRSAILMECVASFRPELILVDHTPAGLGGELLPILDRARANGVKTVLGLRDIIDEPARVRAQWKGSGVTDLLLESYDTVLHYGDQRIFDPIRMYGLPENLRPRILEMGYVVRPPLLRPGKSYRKRLGLGDEPLVVVTAGGGGDGHRLLRTHVEAVRRLGRQCRFQSLLVTGPLMSYRKRRRIVKLAAGLPSVHVVDFIRELPDLYREAGAVISMGGYNSVSEILASGVPALIVPRVKPRLEQWVRASILAGQGLVRCLHPDEMSRRTLSEAALSLLREGVPSPRLRPRMGALEAIEEAFRALSHSGGAERPEPVTSTGCAAE